MCILCLTKAELVQEDVLPGFHLYQAQRDYSPEWMAGEYGLVEYNFPIMIFSQSYMESLTSGKDIHQEMTLAPLTGYHVVNAAFLCGWNPKDTPHIEHWIMKKLVEAIEKRSCHES